MRPWCNKQLCQTNFLTPLQLAGLLEEVKSLVDSNLLSFQCVFNSRNCNRAAHELAVLGLCCVEGEEHITCDDVPENILVIVADDLSANVN